MFKRKGGGIKGFLNIVKKTALFLHGGFPKPVPFFAQRTLFGYFFAVNLRIFWCTFTGLNNVVVSQN